jgi:hypothetical protein
MHTQQNRLYAVYLLTLRGLKSAARGLQAGSWCRGGCHARGYKPAAARVAAHAAGDADRRTGSAVAACDLARCGRRCGSALGGRPHGIHPDRMRLGARVGSRAQGLTLRGQRLIEASPAVRAKDAGRHAPR